MMLCGSYYNHPTMNLLLVLITTSVLAQGPDGAYGLDPDKKGEQVWQYRAGRGSAIGGVWGSAVDAQQAYIWEFDTNRSFETINGVAAKGGSFDGPGVVVVGGMLYATSGNGGLVGRPATCCSRLVWNKV